MNKLYSVLKYLGYFALLYILAGAGINGAIFPFAVGLFLSLVWCGEKCYILAPLFIAATLLHGFSVPALISSSFTALSILLITGIHYKLKKQVKLSLYFVYVLISQIGFVFSEVYFNGAVLTTFLSVVGSVLFMQCCNQIFSAILVRGFAYKLSSLEIISACVLLGAISCGLTAYNFWGFELIKLFAVFMVLFSAYTFNVSATLVVGITMGLGSLLFANNPELLAPFSLFSLTAVTFKSKYKFIPALALIAVDLCLGYFVGAYYSYSYISVIPCVLAAATFLFIPNRILENVSGVISSNSNSVAMRNVVNRSREGLTRRLYNLSEVFREMDYVFRSMIKGGMSKEEVKEILLGEIKEKVCADCKEKNYCHRVCQAETEKVLSELVNCALERGRTTLLDVPSHLTSRCSRVSNLVSVINNLTAQYKQYASFMNNLDASRVLIAEQLSGVSKIMKNLAGEVNKNVIFDAGRENTLIDELTYNNIVCADAVIYEQNTDVTSATLVVRNEDAEKVKIPSIVSKVCGNKMVVADSVASSRSGYRVLTLKTAPKYDVIFGSSSCTKEGSEKSGDCFSLIRIENDKFMFALCDGMGSGEKAEKASSLAIGLIENFYKAGFDNDIILSSVNKLLSLNREEVFSALDICVMDLKQGIADFIKMGAPNSFIKHESEISMVESGALPLGIVQDAPPAINKTVLSTGDYVFLCTDGITDSFESNEKLKEFINNLKATNPQTLAETLVEKAVENSGGSAGDDMTVLVAKIFEKA